MMNSKMFWNNQIFWKKYGTLDNLLSLRDYGLQQLGSALSNRIFVVPCFLQLIHAQQPATSLQNHVQILVLTDTDTLNDRKIKILNLALALRLLCFSALPFEAFGVGGLLVCPAKTTAGASAGR